MEKRLFIAVGVSLLFLWLYSLLMPKFFPEMVKAPAPVEDTVDTTSADPAVDALPNEGETRRASSDQPTEAPIATASEAAPAPAAVVPTPVSESREIRTVVENDAFRAVFSNRGGQLVSFQVKRHVEKDGRPVELVTKRDTPGYYPFLIESSSLDFNRFANLSFYATDARIEGGKGTLEYRLVSSEGWAMSKRFEFRDPFLFDVSFQSGGFDGTWRAVVGPGVHAVEGEVERSSYVISGGIVATDDDFDTIKKHKGDLVQVFPAGLKFIGLEDAYFLSALKPIDAGQAVMRRVETEAKVEGGQAGFELVAGLNAVGGRLDARAFFGPKEADLLEPYGFEEALHLGFFGWIARMLLYAMVWVNNYTNNYGWAIVVLTVIIRILLLPLQHKSIVSMKKMQKVQPKVNALRDKFKKAKTDPEQRQKMNEEMMKLYKEEGINPASGCFPILLQAPILWAFYSLLSQAIELRGEPFILWITDLSLRDPYYLTPILMTITMVIQQKMTPTTIDPAQQKIMMAMPFVFGFIFKDLPSGLVLYWLVQNLLSIAQQAFMNRWWKDHPIEMSSKAQKQRA
jgi:YidC/Oxa1 family membrane protein insertase